MAITVYSPFRALDSTLARDSFFREFFRDFERSAPAAEATALFAPRLNVSEHERAYEATLEIPGIAKEDVHIEVENRRLAVWGEKRAEKATDGERKLHVREITYGSFRRELVLPDDVDAEKIAAAYDNGHLKLTLPRIVKQKTTRQVSIS